MKKIILVLVLIAFVSSNVFAKTYVLRDKLTGLPQGTASISDEAVIDWAEKFILTSADESYRGKKSYEIVYENGQLRHATEQEISDYLSEKEQEQEDAITAKKKQDFLDMLEDVDVVDKIKDKVKP